jgi:hypothetical protein
LKEIPGELKKGMPSEEQKQNQNQNLHQSLRTPWISGSFEAQGSSLESLSCWSNKIWGEIKNQRGCIYDPRDLLRSYDRLRIMGDNGFEEISEQKIIYSETRGHVLTPFFWKKQVKRDKEKQPVKSKV